MQLAEVIGTVVVAHADASLLASRLVLVQEVDGRGNRVGRALVAADTVGATDGDTVLLSRATAGLVRRGLVGDGVDCGVVAIVDHIEPAILAAG